MTWTILHDACLHGDLSTILTRSVDFPQEICQLDEHGSTPLHLACYSYNQNMQQIIQTPRMKDAILLQDYHGNTPLHVMLSNPAAVDKNAVQSIVMTHPQVLLITNREGLTPLHVACRFIPWREDIITLILETFPQAATMRIKRGDKVVNSPEPSVSHQHAVIEGCPRRGTYGTSLQELRFHHLGIQLRDGSYPLHMAVAAAADVIAGKVIPSSMVTSITSDTIHSLFHVLDMLIRAAPDVVTWTNKFGETPLHIALRSSSSLSSSATSTITSYQDDVVELLLKADPYNLAVTMRDDREGNLPLHLAIATAFTSVSAIVQILARFPSAIRVTNSNGKLPIELARGNAAIIGIFKDYGKDHVVVCDDDDNNVDASKNVSTVWNKTSYHQPVH